MYSVYSGQSQPCDQLQFQPSQATRSQIPFDLQCLHQCGQVLLQTDSLLELNVRAAYNKNGSAWRCQQPPPLVQRFRIPDEQLAGEGGSHQRAVQDNLGQTSYVRRQGMISLVTDDLSFSFNFFDIKSLKNILSSVFFVQLLHAVFTHLT